jgi:pyruvate dehydrogenase E2 component (dihydrolipoamide acetyltransferase)
MTEGVVASWTRKPGDYVDRNDVIAEIESEKVSYDLEAIGAGIFHPVVGEGAIAPVDGIIAYLLAEGEAPPADEEAEKKEPITPGSANPQASAPPEKRTNAMVVPSTPGARKLAASLGVDISRVTPSGPRGRVVDSDVHAYAEQQGTAESHTALPLGLPRPVKVIPVSGMRKSIAENMRTSLAATAQLSYFLEIDITDAQRMRNEVSQDLGNVITLPHVLIKACSAALEEASPLNSVLAEGNVLFFDQINIGVAVALQEGLVVPVLRDVGQMDILQISNATHELAVKAREGSIAPDDMVGGTFTISVLGAVDGFTPILNPGQSAILGAGRPTEKPVVRNGDIVIREMITFSLTADHQVIDGAVAAAFLQRLQETLENPEDLFD